MQKALIVFCFICVPLFSADNTKGSVPRTSAAAYPEHTQGGDITIGASLLGHDKVRRTFVSDINRCCYVVEVAVYPLPGKTIDLSVANFTLRNVATDEAVRPSSADVVVAMVRKEVGPSRTVNVAPSAGVGYQSGIYDPVVGSQAPGPIYQAGVAVSTPSAGPRPGSTEKDRQTMENELAKQSLPEGQATAPVSGFLYFPIAGKKKGGTFQLTYSSNGTNVMLPLQ